MISVRRATHADVGAIAKIAADAWRSTYRDLVSPDAIETTLSQWYTTDVLRQRVDALPLDVALRRAEVVGYVQHGPIQDSVHEVYALYVAPAELGTGAGWALWQGVCREARVNHKTAVELWVLEGNRQGISWYDRQGGHPVGTQPIEMADGPHVELRYRFNL